MRKIYKYDLEMGTDTFLELPLSSKILKFDMQGGVFRIWCEVETTQPNIEITFRIYPTGAEVERGWTHVESILIDNGELVWHLYNKIGNVIQNEDM